MKHKIKSAATVAAIAAAAGGVILASAGAAGATSTPSPWVGTDSNEAGGLIFLNSAGQVVTGGNLADQPVAAYVAGTQTLRAGDTKATLYVYRPDHTKVPALWNVDNLSASPSYPNTTAPAPINSTTLPVTTGVAGDYSLLNVVDDLPQADTTSGYVNEYEIRMRTSAAGKSLTSSYNYADIVVSNLTTDSTGAVTGGTWAVTYTPSLPQTATTTVATATDTVTHSDGSIHDSDPFTLSATVTGASGGAINSGTVQFMNGSTAVGSPVPVSNGVATETPETLTAPASSVTAVFTPGAPANVLDGGYAASTSPAVSVSPIVHDQKSTAVALAESASTGAAYVPVTLTATVTPTIAGTVAFFDNGNQIASVTASAGSASTTYTPTVAATEKFTATFTPTNTTDYTAGSSAEVDYVTTAAQGYPAVDNQAIKATVPAGSLAITTPYTTAHPLNLGTMQLDPTGDFFTVSAPFGDGTFATYSKDPTTGNPVEDGTGSIQVVDTRAGNSNWTVSVLSSGLVGTTPSNKISGENLGLTGLTQHLVAGNTLGTAAEPVTPTNIAVTAPVAPGDTGTAGLGGTVGHTILNTTTGGFGSIGYTGTLTLLAPSSTKADTYTGTITFTVG